MNDPCLPLFVGHDSRALFIQRRDRAVSRREFWAQAVRLAETLPEASAALNLCEDRYHFLLGFVALILRRQVNLLPPDRAAHTLRSLATAHPGLYCLVDTPQPTLSLPQQCINPTPPDSGLLAAARLIPASQHVATVFTSGSSRHSQPHPKSWGQLHDGACLNAGVLPFGAGSLSLLATVPAQHMYGLETSILLPLLNDMVVAAARPLLPADVQRALDELPSPRWLISTPLHLHACLRAGLEWPALHGIISATAPLSAALATELETAFACRLWEIYGSTESGAIATRRTTVTEQWRLHPGLSLQGDNARGWHVRGTCPGDAVALQDRLEPLQANCFHLLGRQGDILKVAGKRASLSDLNRQLLAIPGVEDGCFVPPTPQQKNARLSAVVVAPGLSRQAILAALRQRIDAVFLPRPLHRVERLPRNATGKLPREALNRLLAEQSPTTTASDITAPHQVEITIPADHPCLAGHFPGRPLVPGVVILDGVLAALREWLPERRVQAIHSGKFLMPLLPEQGMTITLHRHDTPDTVSFECQHQGQRLASGRLVLETRSGP